MLTLLPRDAVSAVQQALESLAGIAAAAAREHLKALEVAREVVEGHAPEELEDFLVAIDRVATLEHTADEADRSARAVLIRDAPDFRSLHVADAVSRGIEDATDALMRSAFRLRDHILGQVPAR